MMGVSDLPVGLLADDDGRIAVEARQKAALLNVERVLHHGALGGDANRPFQHVHLIDDDQGERPLAWDEIRSAAELAPQEGDRKAGLPARASARFRGPVARRPASPHRDLLASRSLDLCDLRPHSACSPAWSLEQPPCRAAAQPTFATPRGRRT
jgi:hypothetical protein